MKKINGNFTMIPNNLINDNRLDVYEFRVLCYLLKLADDNFCCYPSYETIAKETGMSVTKAINVIKKLSGYCLITKESRETTHSGHIANYYTLCVNSPGGDEADRDADVSSKKASVNRESSGICRDKSYICDDGDICNNDAEIYDGEVDIFCDDDVYDDEADIYDDEADIYDDEADILDKEAYARGKEAYSLCNSNQYTYTNNQNKNNHCINTHLSTLKALMDRAETYKLKGQLKKSFENALEIMYTSKSITVGGEEIPREEVRERLENISYEHIVSVDRNKPRKVVDGKLIDEVRNPVAYIVTALFNALRYTEKEIQEIEYGEVFDGGAGL